MPMEEEIPDSIRPIRRRQFLRIDHESYKPVTKELVFQLANLDAKPRRHAGDRIPQIEYNNNSRQRNSLGAAWFFYASIIMLGLAELVYAIKIIIDERGGDKWNAQVKIERSSISHENECRERA